MSGEQPADPYTHRRLREDQLKAERVKFEAMCASRGLGDDERVYAWIGWKAALGLP